MHQEARSKITKARIALITERPFYGSLAMRLRMVEEPKIPTLAVDGINCFYNPDFIMTLPPGLVKSALAHEVGHCVFEHIDRRGNRNPVKWNCAGDFVINLDLHEDGFEIGDGWLLDKQFKNMTAEQVYALLPDPPSNGGNGGALCEIMPANKKVDPMVMDDWKIATVQAAMNAKAAGKLSKSMERFVHDLVYPKADWRQVLRRFVTEQRRDDFSWLRPNKMMVPHGFYLPTLWSEGMGEIVVVVDTSGSITDQVLQLFKSEIQSIRDSVRPRMTRVVYCDSHVNHVDEFQAEDLLEMRMVGGGGTDFRPPFALVEKHGWQPSVGLYLTDGYGPFPDMPSPFPFMWCMTTNVEPPWGERVQIELD